MDVRKPHAAHSWREFAIEIGTITIGILIALGLEALVQAAENRELVSQARAQLVAELKFNRENLAEVIGVAKTNQTSLRQLILYGQNRLEHRPQTPLGNVSLTGSFTTLRTAAWESTVATQAMVHMPFSQAHAVATVYASSRGFNSLEEKVEQRWFDLALYGSDVNKMSDAEVKNALGELRVLLSYQTAAADSGTRLLADYDRALAALKR